MKIQRVIVAAGLVLGLGFVCQDAEASAVLSGSTTADNGFFAYVSTSPTTLGTLIGSGNNWLAPFSVSSASLSPGTYYLQIEAINQGGPGGFSGVFNLTGDAQFANGTQQLTTDLSNLSYWTGSYNSSNSNFASQPWIAPTGAVDQDTSYGWGNIVGTPSWIWPSDSSSSPGGPGGVCGNCTVDIEAEFTVASTSSVPEPSTWAILFAGLGGLGFLANSKRWKQSGAGKLA